MTAKEKTPTGLALMREPFAPNQISQLPKPTRAQTDAVKKDFKVGIRCQVCGQWHHPKVVHLDYVGHAALTDRLLDCDPEWNWAPVKTDESGVPIFDANGGMWIKLTVCGITRLGYGDAAGKNGGDAVKEVIGDALRNAAMRFGAALDLWHKGELHVDEDKDDAEKETTPDTSEALEKAREYLCGATDLGDLKHRWENTPKDLRPRLVQAKDAVKNNFTDNPADQIDDHIPY